jgi:hypothetical protein
MVPRQSNNCQFAKWQLANKEQGQTREPSSKGKLSTVDLLVLTSLDYLLLIIKILFTSFTKEAALIRRSIVLNLSPQYSLTVLFCPETALVKQIGSFRQVMLEDRTERLPWGIGWYSIQQFHFNFRKNKTVEKQNDTCWDELVWSRSGFDNYWIG